MNGGLTSAKGLSRRPVFDKNISELITNTGQDVCKMYALLDSDRKSM